MDKKLIRPKEGKVFFGVAAALGNYFNIDPVIVRIVFVILAVWGGAGVLLYIIGIFLIPSEEDLEKNRKKNDKEEMKERVESVAEEIRQTAQAKTRQKQSSMVFGLIVMIIGILFLAANFFPWFGWGKMWPLILIIFGLLILAGG